MNETLEKVVGTAKALRLVHRSSATHWVGNGFPVRSVFDYNGLGRELSPFLLLDYAAPSEFPPGNERRGVGAHPHRGFETVTVVYKGELEHRDSSGGGGRIGPGDAQWMTAAGGIVHEEFHSEEFTRRGGTLEMIQLWVNLPAKFKGEKPGYQTLLSADIPSVSLPGDAGRVRVIAGEFGGARGPARTFTPILVGDAELNAGSVVRFPAPAGYTTAFLTRHGRVQVGKGETAGSGELVVYGRDGDWIEVRAETDAGLLLLAGEPILEPVVGHGPFVMNSRAEIARAFEDYQLGRMGAIRE